MCDLSSLVYCVSPRDRGCQPTLLTLDYFNDTIFPHDFSRAAQAGRQIILTASFKKLGLAASWFGKEPGAPVRCGPHPGMTGGQALLLTPPPRFLLPDAGGLLEKDRSTEGFHPPASPARNPEFLGQAQPCLLAISTDHKLGGGVFCRQRRERRRRSGCRNKGGFIYIAKMRTKRSRSFF